MTEIKVPTLGESVSEATVGAWQVSKGDSVKKDDVLVELETDKVAVEVRAEEDGVIEEILAEEGDTVEIGAALARLGAGSGAKTDKSGDKSAAKSEGKDQDKDKSGEKDKEKSEGEADDKSADASGAKAMPAAKRVAAENDLDLSRVEGTGKDGRVTKGDALKALEGGASAPAPAASAPSAPRETGEREERVKMTRLRQTIARRLKEAQNSAAMLTTYNEADMSAIMALRKQVQDDFTAKHGVKLGFMSFFVKACVAALKDIPAVNAEIDGTDIIYKNYYDIGVAVGTDKGLVVPVVRDCDVKSLAEIESGIGDLGKRARDGKLAIEDMQGATFTISNGGVYGSLMSSPILNAPQSGILGMHKIQERPMAINGEVKIRPMMYLALSYDHRIVDGKEAVTFLVRVKESLENPQRLLLDI
ncbi:2-oxoglutarate dehydrogenase complex dihydrolipoyllysine-residue succinyltransferase [Alkalicaulis satelles]|uniref:Dihydrolipoyllysine-residue succinyltransferase component of 2-oxoglutarate dehydrogenase complex n=1 Tax=Alkalicaulis satelles TaxID=2609175 RepID=A0A5M6ZKX4_9PROT|nr:2-oxoglutarate dehydrogenase complex dihydrolipoyllysine-residue succinyltransferase [Alkalicaulis satelles]KAA5803868.1 2-oxoglutarate dehydrogenase complex dihydrolipoyllysine-residue succinyltransferase [Alkalicaulis satelles]